MNDHQLVNRELCARLGIDPEGVRSVHVHLAHDRAPTMTVERFVVPHQLEGGMLAKRIELRSFVLVDRPEADAP